MILPHYKNADYEITVVKSNEVSEELQTVSGLTAPDLKNVNKELNDGLNDQTKSLSDLAVAIEPIITKFDETLVMTLYICHTSEWLIDFSSDCRI